MKAVPEWQIHTDKNENRHEESVLWTYLNQSPQDSTVTARAAWTRWQPHTTNKRFQEMVTWSQGGLILCLTYEFIQI